MYPDVPALIVSGELDNLTTLVDGAAVAAAFKRGSQVRIANSFHVNALPRARSSCGAALVRRFITTLTAGDASCAARVPPLRLIPQFAASYIDLEPAVALPGNHSSGLQLQAVTAALRTTTDVLTRAVLNSSGHGAGLRGGGFRLNRSPRGLHVSLDRVRWTNDVEVTGSVDYPRLPGAAVRAALQVSPAGGTSGRLSLTWRAGLDGPAARIAGAFGGARVLARAPTP